MQESKYNIIPRNWTPQGSKYNNQRNITLFTQESIKLSESWCTHML